MLTKQHDTNCQGCIKVESTSIVKQLNLESIYCPNTLLFKIGNKIINHIYFDKRIKEGPNEFWSQEEINVLKMLLKRKEAKERTGNESSS